MANFTANSVAPTGMTGTPAAPTAIAAGGSNTATFALRTLGQASNVARATAGCRVLIGASAPTTNPTVQWQYSLDGTNFVNDGGAFVVPLTPSTAFDYPYKPPPEAVAAACVVTNGATNGVSAWAQCDALSMT